MILPILAIAINLTVTYTHVDLDSHYASIELTNSGTKTVAAYSLDIHELKNGKEVDNRVILLDNLYYSANNARDMREDNLIKPGQQFTYVATTRPDTTDVRASILAVVYMDRTSEGDPAEAHLIFKQRERLAASKKRSKDETAFWAKQSQEAAQ